MSSPQNSQAGHESKVTHSIVFPQMSEATLPNASSSSASSFHTKVQYTVFPISSLDAYPVLSDLDAGYYTDVYKINPNSSLRLSGSSSRYKTDDTTSSLHRQNSLTDSGSLDEGEVSCCCCRLLRLP